MQYAPEHSFVFTEAAELYCQNSHNSVLSIVFNQGPLLSGSAGLGNLKLKREHLLPDSAAVSGQSLCPVRQTTFSERSPPS